jgi:hypothetical protein
MHTFFSAPARHYLSGVIIFIIFFTVMLIVIVAAYSRRSGGTGLDMGKIQQLRYSHSHPPTVTPSEVENL